MSTSFKIALEKALGIVIGLMAVELIGRGAFSLSLAANIIQRVMP